MKGSLTARVKVMRGAGRDRTFVVHAMQGKTGRSGLGASFEMGRVYGVVWRPVRAGVVGAPPCPTQYAWDNGALRQEEVDARWLRAETRVVRASEFSYTPFSFSPLFQKKGCEGARGRSWKREAQKNRGPERQNNARCAKTRPKQNGRKKMRAESVWCRFSKISPPRN